jgi:hypothetical protein
MVLRVKPWSRCISMVLYCEASKGHLLPLLPESHTPLHAKSVEPNNITMGISQDQWRGRKTLKNENKIELQSP